MSLFKGWIGELRTKFHLWFWLRSKSYHRFHDIILPSKNGTTQIDHLIISVYGIFIIETKNKKGWIYGSEKKANWTQSIFGRKYSFQNPLRQTFRQKKILSEFLQLDESYIHPIVYFNGDCAFKTLMPENVLDSDLAKYIRSYQIEKLSTAQVDLAVCQVQSYISTSDLTTKDHLKSLQNRHSSKTTCPKCGSNLIERIAKKGSNAGTPFLGCENYPKCRFSKNI